MEYLGTSSEAWRNFTEAANLAYLKPRLQDRRLALEKLAGRRGSEVVDRLGAIASLIANRRNSGMRRPIDRFERQEFEALVAVGVPVARIAGLVGVQPQWLEQELKGRTA